jgi:hypothetical protein
METFLHNPHWPIQKMLVMAVADRMISNRYKRSRKKKYIDFNMYLMFIHPWWIKK